MSKTKTSKSKTKKPLTISIHGDGIDIDATLGSGDGHKALLAMLDGAATSVMRRHVPETQAAPPTADEDLQAYVNAMLAIIGATDAPETLHKLEEMLEHGRLAIKERLGQVNGTTAHA